MNKQRSTWNVAFFKKDLFIKLIFLIFVLSIKDRRTVKCVKKSEVVCLLKNVSRGTLKNILKIIKKRFVCIELNLIFALHYYILIIKNDFYDSKCSRIKRKKFSIS